MAETDFSSEAVVAVCNDALLELGQKVPVVHLVVDGEHPVLSPNERVCAGKYDDARRAVLGAGGWKFATRQVRVECSALEGVEHGDFGFEFALPEDALYVVAVEHNLPIEIYTREEAVEPIEPLEPVEEEAGEMPPEAEPELRIVRMVRTKRPVKWCRYVRDDVDIGNWSAELRILLVRRLAADICLPVTGSAGVLQAAEERYKAALDTAAQREGAYVTFSEYAGATPVEDVAYEDATVRLCNDALAELGVGDVAVERLAPRDGRTMSVVEAICASKVQSARQHVLALHPWTFAMRVQGVVSMPSTGAFRDGAFKFRFKKPGLAMRIREVSGHKAFFVRGDWVYTKHPVASVEFIEDVENPGEWDPLARMVWVRRLACDIAMALNKGDLLQACELRFRNALDDARLSDAKESRPMDGGGDMNPICSAMEGAYC